MSQEDFQQQVLRKFEEYEGFQQQVLRKFEEYEGFHPIPRRQSPHRVLFE